jgi:hypothetical protein
MTLRELEKRLTQLESQVTRLQSEVHSAKGRKKPAWKHSLEKFADDQDLLSIFSEAMKLREAERRKARNGKPKARRP